MSNYQTGEYAWMMSGRARGVKYPRSHVVRVVAHEYMEGMDPSGWAEAGSLHAEDRRLISEMLTRDGLNHDLLDEIAAYIVATAIETAGD